MDAMTAKPHIGTSGWSYDHWIGAFYPEDLPGNQRLAYYARRLRSAEINSAFYGLPSEKTLRTWREAVPEDFLFATKASRYITHMKKLKDPDRGLERFFRRMCLLGDRLGPILFQLPPHWHFNAERLEGLLAGLSRDFRYAFEFRDHSWINERTLELLARYDTAFCIYELDGFLSPGEVTTDFVYLRLHGPAGPYCGNYSDRTLSGWASTLSRWRNQGLGVHCYFDNDEAGYAVDNAMTLESMLERDQSGSTEET